MMFRKNIAVDTIIWTHDWSL